MATPALPLATIACTISPTGISAPTLPLILASVQASVQAIYGSDTYLDPSTKDGQLLAVLAQAQSDSNQATIGVATSYNPQTAQGVLLDAAVAVNSIQRQASSASTAAVLLVGQAGTQIPAGIIADASNNSWAIPPNTVIPPAGQILVTATCQAQGNIVAPANTITKISTVISGWQTVTNPAAAVPGAPVEEDGALRERQKISTSITAETSLSAILSALAQVPGVSRTQVYQNDGSGPNGNGPDANGIPVHYIAVVVLGGDALAVATAIQSKKDVGAGTYGTQSQIVIDQSGVPCQINYFPLQLVALYASITITPLTGYTAATGQDAIAALVDFVNGLAIGEKAYSSWCSSVASLAGTAAQQTFVITSFFIGTAPNPHAPGDVAILFNQAATMVAANVTLAVG